MQASVFDQEISNFQVNHTSKTTVCAVLSEQYQFEYSQHPLIRTLKEPKQLFELSDRFC